MQRMMTTMQDPEYKAKVGAAAATCSVAHSSWTWVCSSKANCLLSESIKLLKQQPACAHGCLLMCSLWLLALFLSL
jgi:hypothetical protein